MFQIDGIVREGDRLPAPERAVSFSADGVTVAIDEDGSVHVPRPVRANAAYRLRRDPAASGG